MLSPRQLECLRDDHAVVLESTRGLDEDWVAPMTAWRVTGEAVGTLKASNYAAVRLHRSGSPSHRLRASNPTLRSEPGLLSVEPHGREAEWHFSGPASFIQIYLAEVELVRLAEEVHGPGPEFELLDDRVGFFDLELDRLAGDYVRRAEDQSNPPSLLEMDSRATLLALRLITHHSSRNRPPLSTGRLDASELKAVQEFIDANLERPLRLEELARATGMGRFQFSRAFRAATGQPPHRYVLNRRIARAKTLLLSRDTSIADIAYACGFASQAHMTTTFKRLFGVTPNKIRQGA